MARDIRYSLIVPPTRGQVVDKLEERMEVQQVVVNESVLPRPGVDKEGKVRIIHYNGPVAHLIAR